MIKIYLPLTYLVVLLAAVAYMFANSAVSPLSGVYLVLATLPWSLVLTPILKSVLPGLAVLALSAWINCMLLYCIGMIIDRFLPRAKVHSEN